MIARSKLAWTWLVAVCASAELGCGGRTGLVPPGTAGGSGGGLSSGGSSWADGGSSGGGEDGGHRSGTTSSSAYTSTSSTGVVHSSTRGGKDGGSSCGVPSGNTAPSCGVAGEGTTDCGECVESCCESPEVSGGTYFRTYTNTGAGPTAEADPATVSSLGLDKYLVSVGRFRAFVQAWDGGLGYAPPVGSGRHTHVRGGRGLENAGAPGTYEAGWDESFTSWLSPTDQELAKCGATSTWTPEPGSGEDLPITCVSWYEAYAFCIWDGGFLPSEAEWEYAAAGGAKQREYPWGSASPGTKSAYAVFDCQYSRGDAGSCQVAPVEVAAAGAALWGQLDMAGDIWEWTLDWFADYADPCVDCAQLTPALFRVLRGGSYDSAREDILPPARTGRYPSGRQTYGVRCARSP